MFYIVQYLSWLDDQHFVGAPLKLVLMRRIFGVRRSSATLYFE